MYVCVYFHLSDEKDHSGQKDLFIHKITKKKKENKYYPEVLY